MLALHAYFIKSRSLIHLKPQATTANVKLYNYIQFTDLVQGQNMLEIELICKLDTTLTSCVLCWPNRVRTSYMS